MEEITESTDTLVADSEELSLGEDIVKTLVISTAATVGTVAGLLVCGFVYGKIKERREAKAARKLALVPTTEA